MTEREWMNMYDVVGAAMEVYNQLGRGMQEPIYQEAMAIELGLRDIPFEREKPLAAFYKGVRLAKAYVADFFSKDIVIEFKSVEQITSDHRAQLFNYMRITQSRWGLLFNFGECKLRSERYMYIPEEDDFILLTKRNYMQYIDKP